MTRAFTRVTVTLAAVGTTVLAATVLTWLAGRPASASPTGPSSEVTSTERESHAAAGATAPTPRAQAQAKAKPQPSGERPDATNRAAARRRSLREQIARSRSNRDRLPVAVSNDGAREYLQTIMSSNRQIAEQMEIFDDCFSDSGAVTEGVVQLETDLIGEAHVGMLFDEVTVVEDSVGDDAFAECLQESLRSVELEAPQRAYYQHYRYTFDFASGEQQVHAVPTDAHVAEIRASFPGIDDTPYRTLVDQEPDGVAFGHLPGRQDPAAAH